MFNDLQYVSLFTRSASDILINISVALLCGLLVAGLYRLTYRGASTPPSFLSSLVLLSMITSVVIMIIGNNLARAFGLVGAMSIIRFRTAVKETLDIIFIFFSLTVGMAAGVGYYQIALIGTVFIGAILLLFTRASLAAPQRKEYLLQFVYHPNGEDRPGYQNVLKQHCRQHQIINVKSVEEHDLLELSYYVRLRDKEESGRLVQNLGLIHGVRNINLFFDQEEF